MSARWQEQARCAGLDPALFFPEQGVPTTEAKAVCRACPVRAECLAHGLDEKVGVWGGLSERQRRLLRQRSVSARCCRFCGDRFTPDDAKVRYCSKLCERAMQTERQRIRRAS